MLSTKRIKGKRQLSKGKSSSGECEHGIVKPTIKSIVKPTFLQWDREELLFHLCLSLSINLKVALVTIDYGFELSQNVVTNSYLPKLIFLNHFINIGIVLFTCALHYL